MALRSKSLIIILSVIAIILIAIITCGVIYISVEDHKILSKKFKINISESYEIVMFQNGKDSYGSPRCRAKLKVNEDEYKILHSELIKSDYTTGYWEEYIDNSSGNISWIDRNDIVETHTNHDAVYIYRIKMNIYITNLDNGYRYIYMEWGC